MNFYSEFVKCIEVEQSRWSIADARLKELEASLATLHQAQARSARSGASTPRSTADDFSESIRTIAQRLDAMEMNHGRRSAPPSPREHHVQAPLEDRVSHLERRVCEIEETRLPEIEAIAIRERELREEQRAEYLAQKNNEEQAMHQATQRETLARRQLETVQEELRRLHQALESDIVGDHVRRQLEEKEREDERVVNRLERQIEDATRSVNLHADKIKEIENLEVLNGRVSTMSSQLDSLIENVTPSTALATWGDQVSYSFGRSTWDACFCISLGPVTVGNSLLIVVMTLIGVALELLLCWIIWQRSPSTLSEEDVQQLEDWRLLEGHSVQLYDKLTNTSLVARVCRQSTSALPSTTQSLTSYQRLQPFLELDGELSSIGRMLNSVCVLLWTLLCFKKLMEACTLNKIVWSKCMTDSDRGTTIIRDSAKANPGLNLHAVLKIRARLMSALVYLCRLPVLGFLMVTGFASLTQSYQMEDMLFAAMALLLASHMENLLYASLAPTPVKSIMERLRPVVIQQATDDDTDHLGKAEVHRHAAPYGDSSIVFGVVLFIAAAIFPEVLVFGPMWERAGTAHDALCSGNLDFVVARNPGTQLLHVARTSSIEDGDFHFMKAEEPEFKYFREAMRKLTASDGSGFAIEEASVHYVSNLLHMGTQEAIDSQLECSDRISESAFGDHREAASALLRHYFTDVDESADCSMLEKECTGKHKHMVRALCPLSCSCGDSLSGLFQLDGCPRSCQGKRLAHLATHIQAGAGGQCSKDSLPAADVWDRSLSELANSTGNSTGRKFLHFVKDFQEYLNKTNLLNGYLELLNVTNMSAAAVEHGCSFIEDITSQGFTPSPCDMSSPNFGSLSAFCPRACGIGCAGLHG